MLDLNKPTVFRGIFCYLHILYILGQTETFSKGSRGSLKEVYMGKQGPCCHCGISTTPLWRNGPPEKPVLCNACGSRWRTKGTLANYMPMHSGGCGANGSLDYKWPRGKKVSQKFKEQRSHKRKEPSDIHQEIEFRVANSNQQHAIFLDEDASTRSSSVSGLSYSEGCMQHAGAFEKFSTVAWESPIPSKKKRTCMFRQRPSSVENLTKIVQVSQGQDLSYLSSSSDDDLLYECKDQMVAPEIGLGGVFIRQPYSATREEESEASSLLIDNKGYSKFDVSTQAYSGVVETPVQILGDDITGSERWMEMKELKRLLQSCHSPLISIELEDIVNFDTFMGLLKEEEQQHLVKYLSSVDHSGIPESLKCMFNSGQFKVALSNFQHLLSEGMFGTYGSRLSPQVERLFQQLLNLTDLTDSKWMETYSKLQKDVKASKGVKFSEIPECKESTKLKDFGLPAYFVSKPWKHGTYKAFMSSPGQLSGQGITGLEKSTKNTDNLQKSGPNTVHPVTPAWASCNMEGKYHESIDTGSTSKDAAGFEIKPKGSPSLGANSLFASPPERCSSFVFESIGDFADEDSDSVLLFDVPSNLSFPQAELLHTPVLKCKTPKDIVSDVSNLENANSGGPIVNSEDSLDWGSLLWNPSYVGSGQTLSGGTVLNPDKAHL